MATPTSGDRAPIYRDSEKQAEMEKGLLRKQKQEKASAEHRRKGDLTEVAPKLIQLSFDRVDKKGREKVAPTVLKEPKSPEIRKKREQLSVETDEVAKQFLQQAPAIVQRAMKEHKFTIGGISSPAA